MSKKSPPVVTGISPKEATAGTKLTIRGENLGTSQQDLLDVLILGADCLMTAEWKSPNKIVALCPAVAAGTGASISSSESGEIIVTTLSGGVGSCTVTFRAKRETVGPLKEVAYWVNEKNFARRRKNRIFSPSLELQDDALGLSVEGSEFNNKYPEETLQSLFPDKTGDITADNFEPAYFLLENHHGTTFEDLKAGMAYLRRKVDGENENQISFIKANINSIMDQLDALNSIRKRYAIDNAQYGGTHPTEAATEAISKAKNEADQMFFDVLGRKDRADATRNALNVMNRFKFLFFLPVNIRANIEKGDYDRVIDEYDRARSLYKDSDSEIFKMYLNEVEKEIQKLKETLKEKLEKEILPIETQKKLIANLVQLNAEGDPAWNLLQVQYGRLLKVLQDCRDEHVKANEVPPSQFLVNSSPLNNSRAFNLFPNIDPQADTPPHQILFVEDITDRLSREFPDLWKLGQAYFKGDLILDPDSSKSPVFKGMILGCIRYVSNLIRAAVIPLTLKDNEEDSKEDFATSNEVDEAIRNQWLPYSLRHVRNTYTVLIELDLPSQALDIIKKLTTDLRVQCLQMIFQTVIDQVHLLHEKEDWNQEMSDDFGCITELPEMFASLVSDSVSLLKEAIVDNEREENILNFKNAQSEFENMIKNVLSSFAITLENAAIEDYRTGASNVPADSMRMLLCMNNSHYTQTHVLPKIQKSFQGVIGRQLSLENPINEAHRCYHVLDGKLFEAYMELKCEPIVSIIEPSMYVGKFDWARCPKPSDARDYVKEIIHNVISVHSEVERVSAAKNKSTYVRGVLVRLVETIMEEVNRLFCSIHRMNSNGCIQAWVDINCLKLALQPYLNENSIKYLDDAAKPLLELERPGDHEVVTFCESQFKKRMSFHLYAFENCD